MLALISMLIAVAPDARVEAVYGHRTPVQLQLELDSAVVTELKSAAVGPPISTGASVGLRVWRPPVVEGGLQPVLLLAVDGSHSFYDSGNTLHTRACLGFEVWRLTMLFGTGFGFEYLPSTKPRPVVPFSMSLGIHVGPLAIGFAYVREFQFESVSKFDNVVAIPGAFTVFVSRAFDLTE